MENHLSSAGPACQAVLNTPELLESILVHLPMSNLLVSAQRTSRFWAALISSSAALQSHLFFVPRQNKPWDDLEENKLVFEVLPISLMGKLHRPRGSLRRLHDAPRTNMYMKSVCQEHSAWMSDERIKRPEASWRRMLLFQPVPVSDSGGGRPRHLWTERPMEAAAFLAIEQELKVEEMLRKAQTWLHGPATIIFGIRILVQKGIIKMWVDAKDFERQCHGGWIRFPGLDTKEQLQNVQ